MSYPIAPPLLPMLAKLQPEIPRGDGWLYEPKWDGFRAIAYRDGEDVHIGSRNAQPLARYFPEVCDAARAHLPTRAVADGEIILPGGAGLDFEMLQQRIHPAASRVAMLAREFPASFVAFDLLAEGDEDLRAAPFADRRRRLRAGVGVDASFFVTPQTADPAEAADWFDRFEGAGLDGIIAKRADGPYVHGERVMAKIKHRRTADCVVGGYRLHKDGRGIGSLLLGLYEGDVLHYAGFTSSFTAPRRREILQSLRPLEGGAGFGEGRGPGGPSRWNSGREATFVPLDPVLVCEVSFDHMQGHGFRHGTTFVRWRTDKDPRECTYEQVAPPKPFSLDEIVALAARTRGATG